jgi:hypothetical protein
MAALATALLERDHRDRNTLSRLAIRCAGSETVTVIVQDLG